METTLRHPITQLAATYGDQMLALELTFEERMVTMGRDQVRKQIEKAREKKNESATRAGKNLIGVSVDQVSQVLDAFVEKASTGAAGRHHSAVKYLR